VVGVPGRVVFHRGNRIPALINLNHADMPDPVADALIRLQDQIEQLRAQIEELEKGVYNSGHKAV